MLPDNRQNGSWLVSQSHARLRRGSPVRESLSPRVTARDALPHRHPVVGAGVAFGRVQAPYPG